MGGVVKKEKNGFPRKPSFLKEQRGKTENSKLRRG
jgi:hypothetical protein